jgi:flagellar assembly factor FliW
MDVVTARFGKLDVSPNDLLTFEQGVIGLRQLRDWVVLADSGNPTLGWLQAVDSPEVALAVVSPRRFVPDYQVRIGRRDIDGLQLAQPGDAQVAVIVNRCDDGLALNLRAPLIINVDHRLGRQVVVRNEYPVRCPLTPPRVQLRRSA